MKIHGCMCVCLLFDVMLIYDYLRVDNMWGTMDEWMPKWILICFCKGWKDNEGGIKSLVKGYKVNTQGRLMSGEGDWSV